MKPTYTLMICLLGLVLLGCQPPSEKAEKPASGAVAAAVDGPAVHGVLEGNDGAPSLDLSSLMGTPYILYFAAPWTDSADAVGGVIAELGAGIRVVPVLVDARDDVSGRARGLQTQSYRADEKILKAVGGVRALPTAILVSGKGAVAATWPGFVTAEAILADLQALDE